MMEDLVYRLRKRAEIRRQIPSRKSVQEGQPDRLADLLDEAADAILELRKEYSEEYDAYYDKVTREWLEDKCDDPTCEYCSTRPEKPSQCV